MPTPPPAESSSAEKFRALREQLFGDVAPPQSPPPPQSPSSQHDAASLPASTAQATKLSQNQSAPADSKYLRGSSEHVPVKSGELQTTHPQEDALGSASSQRPRRRTLLSLMTLAVAVATTATAAWLTLASKDHPGDDTAAAGIVAGREGPSGSSTAVVRIDDDSSTSVSVHLNLAETTTLLTISVPVTLADLGLTAFSPVVSEVRVLDEGKQIGSTVESLQPGDEVRLFLSRSTSSPVIEYRAVGVSARSRPSPPGRASLLVSPLVIETTPPLSTRVRVSGLDVLNVGCVSVIRGSESCGRQSPNGWIVERTSAESVSQIIAQVNLPGHNS